MSTTKSKFSEALTEWIDVFMSRSMRNSMGFWKETGLSMPQITTLFRLHYRGTCAVSDVSTYLGVTPPAASQLTDRLVQLGLIDRTEDVNDRRVKQLSLTHKGRSMVQKSLDARRTWLDKLVDTLSTEEQGEIAKALGHLTVAARKLEVDVEKA
jgi:MarR family transcriptional regulator, organic hydroperoxide resistance regulator